MCPYPCLRLYRGESTCHATCPPINMYGRINFKKKMLALIMGYSYGPQDPHTNLLVYLLIGTVHHNEQRPSQRRRAGDTRPRGAGEPQGTTRLPCTGPDSVASGVQQPALADPPATTTAPTESERHDVRDPPEEPVSDAHCLCATKPGRIILPAGGRRVFVVRPRAPRLRAPAGK